MKVWKNASTWFTAVAVAVAGGALGGGNQLGPDTAFAKYKAGNLTIGGDIRVRGEFHRGLTFNSLAGTDGTGVNAAFIQQRTVLWFNYDVSSDVTFFARLQDSRNWGADTTGGTGGSDNLGGEENDVHGEALGMREAFILIKNGGLKNLNWKIGRQKVVIGDHRLLGHFDWNNVGFSLDGLRADYTSPYASHIFGWFRLNETNCDQIDTGNCRGGQSNLTAMNLDSDLLIWYNTFKQVKGMTLEPYLFWLLDSRSAGSPAGFTGTTRTGRVAPDQNRWFLGFRANGKAMNKAIDWTGEYVFQTGSQKDALGSKQAISAWATALKGGYTLKNVALKPRFGLEFDYASGSAPVDQDSGGKNTFEGLFPTNHLHYGYMDQMAWKNMVDYSGNVKIHPTKASNLKIAFHILRLARPGDNWYHAGQGVRGQSDFTNQARSLGQELDIIYTHKFKAGKIAVQAGYGHFFSGEYGDRSAAGTGGSSDAAGGAGFVGDTSMDWGYLQVVTKF